MKSITLILISLLVVFSSCEPQVEEEPQNLIQKDKFKKITIELHLLESYVLYEYKIADTSKVAFKLLEQEIYKNYQVTEDVYRESYNYYLRNTEQMDLIYEDIVDSLSKMETQTKVKKE